MKRIAILASGSGSNAKKIIKHFSNHPTIEVAIIGSNNASAGVIEHAKATGVNSYIFNNQALKEGAVLSRLKDADIDYIILAGFLALIPLPMVNWYENRILNIHPALLPEYGGKGMYGAYVHEAVKENNDSKSGMTVHLVNEKYDQGKILFQAAILLNKEDTAFTIQKNVLVQEHQFYATAIEAYILSQKKSR